MQSLIKLRESGERVKQARENSGSSQSQFAQALGIGQGSLSLLENKKRQYLLLTLEYLAQLDIDVADWLLQEACAQLVWEAGIRASVGIVHKQLFGSLPRSYVDGHIAPLINSASVAVVVQVKQQADERRLRLEQESNAA